jgi:long-chain acyl-CoA synthetase
MEKQRTIGRLWRDAVAAERSYAPYLVERDAGWAEVSWKEAAGRVDDLANGLLALGTRRGEAFGILASTRLEWILFDFALALVGAITSPVYATSSPRDCAYVLNHSDAIGVLVEDADQLAKIDEVRNELPGLRHVLTFGDLDALAERGREYAATNPDELARREAEIGEDDLFTYIYTSGTTGPPKACMIRHRNYYAMAAVVDELDDFFADNDVMLLYLPLAHNFGRLMHLDAAYAGFTLALLPDPYRAADALLQVRPTLFPSVPRVYEKIHGAILAGFDALTGWRARLLAWGLRVGRRYSALRQAQQRVPPLLALQRRVANALVYSKVKARLGGRIRLGISGGAPLAKEVGELFYALDILILEGYGLTECTSAATVNRPLRFRFGTVGPALPGVELRLDEDGELLIRTETNFAGYLKDEQATRAVLSEDNWLRSGDIATVDEDGFVTIVDRKKDILVTAGGKKVAPQNLENELKTSKYVSQALAIGDRRPYVTALITLDEDEIAKWREAGGTDVEALIQEVVDNVNGERSRFEQIKRFVILPRDFSPEQGEVTPSLKLRRRVCEEHFAEDIDSLYSGS